MSVNFQPWISEAFKINSGKYGKLLIIGESHYMDDEEENEQKDDIEISDPIETELPENQLTSVIVKGFINGDWKINFFRNLGLAFNQEDSKEVWKNVAFANGIQVSLNSSSSQPTEEEIKTFIPAFWSILEIVQPTKVLICSQRMWKHWMPDNDERSSLVSRLDANGKHSNIWKYNYTGGECIAMGINHPSRFFSHSNWAPLIKEFIAMK